MAEVKPDGLAAVAAFFGTAEKSHSSDTGTPSTPSKHAHGRVGRTLGVGASLGGGSGDAKSGSDVGSAMDRDVADEDSIVRRLRRVSGRKRSAGGGRRNGGAYGEESDEELYSDEDVADHDLDDDEGRTSVVGRRISKDTVVEEALADDPAAPVAPNTIKRMKTKEKGKDSDDRKPKKGRASASETGIEQTPVSGEEMHPLPAEDTKNGEESGTKQKPRRPKKRSRQKNIRKDKRRTKDKPEHLILGRSCYAGRVLTQETQRFLKLPPKKPRREVFGDGFRSNRVLGVEEHVAGMGLAIDDLGKEGNMDADRADDSERKKAESKKKTKKKKSRYKNLMI